MAAGTGGFTTGACERFAAAGAETAAAAGAGGGAAGGVAGFGGNPPPREFIGGAMGGLTAESGLTEGVPIAAGVVIVGGLMGEPSGAEATGRIDGISTRVDAFLAS
ncbi:MAG: hypothetical protein SGI98_09655 [Verrucomicrobiota bacterium]|nr:hypothetical protein [Verrucomicrobiota bacterium]